MRLMTPEERFERIERLLEFAASIQEQTKSQSAEHYKLTTDNATKITQFTELTLRIGGIVEAQAGVMDSLARRMDSLSKSMDSLAQSMNSLAQRMDQLAEAGRRTDERLNTLIIVVERYFSNGHKE